MFLTALGLRVGKWLSNAGSIATLITLAILIATPPLNRWQGTLAEYHPLRLTMPPLTVFSRSVFTKMMFGALSGFDYVAIFAGECRNPARNLTRSVLITAPFIALIYIRYQFDTGIRLARRRGRGRPNFTGVALS